LNLIIFAVLTGILFLLVGLFIFGLCRAAIEFNKNHDIGICFPSFMGIYFTIFKKILILPICYLSAQTFICSDVEDSIFAYFNIKSG